MPVPGLIKIIYKLLGEGLVLKEEHGEAIFYTAVEREDE
jgi:hypothetical protein